MFRGQGMVHQIAGLLSSLVASVKLPIFRDAKMMYGTNMALRSH